MKILFFFFKNVHIPIFEPLVQELQNRPDVEIFYAAPPYNPQIREGVSPEEMEQLRNWPGTWLNAPTDINTDVAVMADCVADRLRNHKKVVNLGHGLIAKGQYYGPSPLIGRENLADVICVPGPWHKQALEPHLYIPIEVTGMSKLDTLFAPFHKASFLTSKGLDHQKKTILWAPTFNMELSGIPVLWSQIRKLTQFGQVLIKFHGTTDKFFKDFFINLAAQTPDLFYIDDADTTPYMLASDLMISDVSSVVFEYTALNKPLILVDNPHQKEYVNYNEQDVEYQFRNMGPCISHPEELVPVVQQQLENPDEYSQQRQHCASQVFAAQDGGNSKRICDTIIRTGEDEDGLSIRDFEDDYNLVLNFQVPEAQLDELLSNHPKLRHAFVLGPSTEISHIQGLNFYQSKEELLSLLEQSTSSHTIVLNQKTILAGTWEKLLFGAANLTKTPVTPSYYQSPIPDLNALGYLKRDRFQIPQNMSGDDLAFIMKYTNPAERIPFQGELQQLPCYAFRSENAQMVFGNDSTIDLTLCTDLFAVPS